jgi:hypothetical protein
MLNREISMDEVHSKDELIRLAIEGRDDFAKKIARISPEQMMIPGVTGVWSVKDIIAHIVEWETLMQKWLDMIIYERKIPVHLAGKEQPNWVDPVNEQIYKKHKDLSLDEVKLAFGENKQVLFDYIRKLPEEALFDSSKYFYRENLPLWHIVAANTHWHYAEHTPDIDAFIDRLETE